MSKFIGYATRIDINDFKKDGIIRVKKIPDKAFTEKVGFSDGDVVCRPLVSHYQTMVDFSMEDIITLHDFEHLTNKAFN